VSRQVSSLTAAVAAAALTVLPVVAPTTATRADAAQPAGYGPSDPFDDALMGDTGPVEPMKNQAKITRTRYGYRITAGQQNSHMTIRAVHRRLRIADTGTRQWKSLARACAAVRVPVGVAATCRVPASTRPANRTLLEVHPRLGNDYINGRGLPAVFEMAVLADRGRDAVYAGSGNDFINAAQDADRVRGGAGNDWMRGGEAGDVMDGDSGRDYMVGQYGRDVIRGGPGTDRIYH
jgi:serralysin